MKKPIYRAQYDSPDFDATCEVEVTETTDYCEFSHQWITEEHWEVLSAWDLYTGEEIDPNLIQHKYLSIDYHGGPLNYDPNPEPYEFDSITYNRTI